ncbi:MAG: nodulation protein NfeD [Gammaproteobacteria bacterium]|nr:nodulation protein NfeD [Gammaproteobacteria bacterium]
MKRNRAVWLTVLLAGFAMAAPAATPAPVMLLQLDGAVGPASADYITRGIERAAREGAQLVVLRMDTPGGLDTSMREIIKAILASPVPVASYVAPSGARAASAGTYILYASHIAAMAPGTNLGAATPVAIGAPGTGAPPQKPGKDTDKAGSPAEIPRDAMGEKAVNDAAAYIRGLAQLRGRNIEWAEQAVREAVSLSATEALQLKVIDYLAPDLSQLLVQVDGSKLSVPSGEVTLDTVAAPQIKHEPDWRTKFLAVITAPNIALILMMIGIYGLFFELANPGAVVPGVIGAISLLLALYALQMLPVNYAGLALILLGLAFMVAEAFVPSFGILGLGGVVAFVVGAVVLMDTDVPGYGISPYLIGTLAVTSAIVLAAIGGLAVKSYRRPLVSGGRQIIGSEGVVVTCTGSECWAQIQGEIWRVSSTAPLTPGLSVRVTGEKGLLLTVIPLAAKGE